MVPNYIAMAGPVFIILILVEIFVAHRRGVSYYRLNDAINDISTGLLMQLTILFAKGLLLVGYLGIYENFRFLDMDSASMGVWIVCFLSVDCAYYWFHRLSHEVNFLWAAHVVHHQSEEYNLAVALRQSTLQPFFSSFFYWPLALIGFPPLIFMTCSAFNTLYQFWLHTQAIGTLGPFEEILVTPSHHRVHHGRNPIYLDRNHGGTFIIWDRLFGTFEREGETVVYGITTPLESWNPIWANLHYWVDLCRTALATQRPIDKLRTFLAAPGWYPPDQGGAVVPPEVSASTQKFDPIYPEGLRGYALIQFALLVALTIGLGNVGEVLGLPEQVVGVVVIVWGLLNIGGLFDGRGWAFASEATRVVVAPLLSFVLLPGGLGWGVTGLFALGTLAFAFRLLGLRDSFGGEPRKSIEARMI